MSYWPFIVNLYNVEIKDNVEIKFSVIADSIIENGVDIGPYARLRNHCHILENVHMGNFVEMKKATFGKGSKAAHLSYIGDATVGENVNIGCGTITSNYDGKNKFQTVIEDNVFVGCNSNLVAPVTVGKMHLLLLDQQLQMKFMKMLLQLLEVDKWTKKVIVKY